MASIRKRINQGTVKFQARIRVSNHPTMTKTFKLRSQAVQWAKETEIQIEKGTLGLDLKELDKTRLSDLLERYLNEITPRKRGRDVEKYRIQNLKSYSITSKQINKIKQLDIIEYKEIRLKEVSSGTVKKDLVLLGHIFETAIKEWGYPLSYNLVRLVTKPKENKSRDRRLEKGEEELLLASCRHCTNSYFEPMVIVAIETAMRKGEILGIERDNLNLTKRTIYLPVTKNGEGRGVPLSTTAIAALNRIPTPISGKLFPIPKPTLRGLWSRACRRAGISNLHFHDLRHEATSRFFEKGLNIMEVSTITGHKDLKMLKRYTHLKAEDLALKLE